MLQVLTCSSSNSSATQKTIKPPVSVRSSEADHTEQRIHIPPLDISVVWLIYRSNIHPLNSSFYEIQNNVRVWWCHQVFLVFPSEGRDVLYPSEALSATELMVFSQISPEVKGQRVPTRTQELFRSELTWLLDVSGRSCMFFMNECLKGLSLKRSAGFLLPVIKVWAFLSASSGHTEAILF